MRHDIQHAIDLLKQTPNPAAIQLLHADDVLRRTVAAWPLIKVAGHAEPGTEQDDAWLGALTVPELIIWVGDAYKLGRSANVNRLREVVGLDFSPSRMDQMLQAALAFPDGTLHPTAAQYIALKNAYIIKSMGAA